MTTYRVKHSHGLTETFVTFAAAITALRSIHGEDLYAVDPSGHECTDSDDPDLSLGRVLVWTDESASEGDSGVRAVASISAAR